MNVSGRSRLHTIVRRQRAPGDQTLGVSRAGEGRQAALSVTTDEDARVGLSGRTLVDAATLQARCMLFSSARGLLERGRAAGGSLSLWRPQVPDEVCAAVAERLASRTAPLPRDGEASTRTRATSASSSHDPGHGRWLRPSRSRSRRMKTTSPVTCGGGARRGTRARRSSGPRDSGALRSPRGRSAARARSGPLARTIRRAERSPR